MLIATLHSISLTDVMPTDLTDKVDGHWFQQLTTTMPLAAVLASPCSTTQFTYINDLLAKHAQTLDNTTGTAFYTCMWYRAGKSPHTYLTNWINHIPEREPAFDHEPGTKEIEMDETNCTANPLSWFHFYSRLLGTIDFQNGFSFPAPIYAYPLLSTA
uniref:Transposase n=1 Tax=Romanomermis culicivorax TaxID=13658 RepID=A0A915ICM4_ROMCU